MYRYVGDRSFEQFLFFSSLQMIAPEVLNDLFQTVLPLHLKAHKRKSGPHAFSEDWTAPCDILTWQAAWDWAERSQLAKGMDLDLLKTTKAIRLATWHKDFFSWCRRRLNRLPSYLHFPFRIRTSPEITFGMPLMHMVWNTLELLVQE